MDEVVLRVAKALILGAVTFFSIWSITGSMNLGAAVAIVPVVFVSLAVFSGIGYSVAALSLCISVILLLTGTEWIGSGRRLVEQIISDVKSDDAKAKVPVVGK
jgi:uncharacterized membrane protein